MILNDGGAFVVFVLLNWRKLQRLRKERVPSYVCFGRLEAKVLCLLGKLRNRELLLERNKRGRKKGPIWNGGAARGKIKIMALV